MPNSWESTQIQGHELHKLQRSQWGVCCGVRFQSQIRNQGTSRTVAYKAGLGNVLQPNFRRYRIWTGMPPADADHNSPLCRSCCSTMFHNMASHILSTGDQDSTHTVRATPGDPVPCFLAECMLAMLCNRKPEVSLSLSLYLSYFSFLLITPSV